MTKQAQIIEADLTWTGRRFERGVRVAVDGDGVISAVGPPESVSGAVGRRLTSCALLPGMINAHSHAFQRGLRGRGETFPEGGGSFWTWRTTMYELVDRMDAATLLALAGQAYREMLAAGITTVGEFHYLHHDASAAGYAFDELMLQAAADAGIRIVLLNAYYGTGGCDRPLTGGQKRFHTGGIDEYWQQMDRLEATLDGRTQSLGTVAHSIRAASLDEIADLHETATRRHLVFHMHLEEQTREIEACLAAYGKPPMALLNERLAIDPRFTAVHCTHTALSDLEEFLAAGGNVCLCPLTEGNLGDGVPNVRQIVKRHGRICLGTDSNARISMTEEMRWLEYVQRLITRSRGVCVDESGRVAPYLWRAATVNGARALGIRAGSIEPGHAADLITLDLSAPSLAGWSDETLLDSFIFGGGAEAVGATCVAGRWVYSKPDIST